MYPDFTQSSSLEQARPQEHRVSWHPEQTPTSVTQLQETPLSPQQQNQQNDFLMQQQQQQHVQSAIEYNQQSGSPQPTHHQYTPQPHVTFEQRQSFQMSRSFGAPYHFWAQQRQQPETYQPHIVHSNVPHHPTSTASFPWSTGEPVAPTKHLTITDPDFGSPHDVVNPAQLLNHVLHSPSNHNYGAMDILGTGDQGGYGHGYCGHEDYDSVGNDEDDTRERFLLTNNPNPCSTPPLSPPRVDQQRQQPQNQHQHHSHPHYPDAPQSFMIYTMPSGISSPSLSFDQSSTGSLSPCEFHHVSEADQTEYEIPRGEDRPQRIKMQKQPKSQNQFKQPKQLKKMEQQKHAAAATTAVMASAEEQQYQEGRNEQYLELKMEDMEIQMIHQVQERRFRCSECKAMFLRQYNLNAHMKTHQKERAFKCEECPRRFLRPYDLSRHQRIHTKDKPYKCRICTKVFVRNDAIWRHFRKDHRGHPDVPISRRDPCRLLISSTTAFFSSS